MKKEDVKDNSFGTASVVLGIFSIIFASIPGAILGLLAVIFASKQKKIQNNKWVKAGFILGLAGIILSAVLIFILYKYSGALLQ